MPRRDSRVQDQNRPGWAEMGAYLIAGSAAAAFGLWRRSWPGTAIALGGAALIAKGVTTAVDIEGSCVVSQTIDRPTEEIYQKLRDLRSWPSFMNSLQSAREEGNFAIWEANVAGKRLRDRIEILDEVPGECILLRSGNAEMPYDVSIELRKAPGDRGTEVRVQINWAGSGTALRELFQSAAGTSSEQVAREGLRRLKQLLEAGEIATTVGQPHGARGMKGKVERAVLRESPTDDRRIRPASQGTAPQAAAS